MGRGGGGGRVIGSRANGGRSHAFQRGHVGQLRPRLEKLANHVTSAARRGGPSRKLGQWRDARGGEYPPGLGGWGGEGCCHGYQAARSRSATERKWKAVAVSVQAVLFGWRARRRHGGQSQWEGGRGQGGRDARLYFRRRMMTPLTT